MKRSALFIALSIGLLQACSPSSKNDLNQIPDSSGRTDVLPNISEGKIQMDSELPSKQSIPALFNEMEVLMRFYGPERPLFDKTWKLPDIKEVK